MITFASDNYASASDRVMQAIIQANQEHAPAYGADAFTTRATELIQQSLGGDYPLWFVGTGTSANTLALKAILKSYESVICADSAHIITHETGAPHHIIGAKFLTFPANNGKISPEQITKAYEAETAWSIHATKPKVVSITQTTELGTVYSLEELKAIRQCCDELDLYLHIDGCRIYNAAASLSCSLADIAQYADVLSLGGTKAGLMFGEAVVFVNKDLAPGFEYLQKQGLQLFSKMRYLSAQFVALFEHDHGLEMAQHTNQLASRLGEALARIEGCVIDTPVESNMIFVELPSHIVEQLQAHTHFYCRPGSASARLVMSHDVTSEHVDSFITHCQKLTE